jgi:SAM-dependent methyltransferase
VAQEIALHVVGVDPAVGAVARARALARQGGMAGRISYVASSAFDLLRAPGYWDAVFFHGSLHHFENVPGILDAVRRSLKPQGLLYLDEYVGRSRADWRLRHLVLPNLAYRLLPRRVRRTHLVRSPVTDEDPTEQVHSADILPAVERFFRVSERRDYGGNLLLLVYPSMRHPGPGGPSAAAFDRAVGRLLKAEDVLLRVGEGSFHVVLWGEPRPVVGTQVSRG